MNIIEYLFLSMKQYFIYVNTLYFIAAGIYFHWRVHSLYLLGVKCRHIGIYPGRIFEYK